MEDGIDDALAGSDIEGAVTDLGVLGRAALNARPIEAKNCLAALRQRSKPGGNAEAVDGGKNGVGRCAGPVPHDQRRDLLS